MTPRLTVVMPLKGRLLFTFRFLWHANKMRLPYRFLIADGNVKEAVAQRLENSRNDFPELDIEYVRYPDDVGYSQFFAKMSDVMQRVRTPYATMADNDDFLGFDGIERALDFLEANKDYVCARGQQVGFSVYSGAGKSRGAICGKFNRVSRVSIKHDFLEAAAPSATERLRQTGLYHRLYHAIYRTPALVQICREAAEIDFSDLMLYEDFHTLRALTLGRAHTNKGAISRYYQVGTGISYQPLRDWARHLLHSHFTSDAHATVKRIASAAANADGTDAAAIAEDVWAILECRYRNFLMMNYGPLARIKRAMRKSWPRTVHYVLNRPRFSVGRERAAVFSQLRNAGAGPEVLERVRGELAAIECALSPDAFAIFARPFLPPAHDDASRDWLMNS
jgi:glycosyltransferase domain-containing protein